MIAGSTAEASAPVRASRRGHWPFGLVLCLVVLPNLLFLATHLASGAVAALCLAAALGALAHVLADLARMPESLDGRLLAVSLAAGFLLCLLGGQAHLVFANDDWLIRDAVLRDLVAEPWPVGYRYLDDPALLRAPLGLYLTPALIGKALGLRAAHLALLAQNAIVFGGVFYAFARTAVLYGGPSGRSFGRVLAVLAIFILFSGWDLVGRWILGRPLTFGAHLDQWVNALQFSAHVTQVFWVPNHAASGWVFVAAYLLVQRDVLGAPSLVIVFGFCVFWSPLSMMGALPFLLLALAAERRSVLLRPRALAAVALAGLGLLPVALYLQADAARVAHGPRTLDAVFVLGYVLFILLELLPFVVVLLLARGVASGTDGESSAPGRSERGTIPLAVGLLLLVPLYQLGSNDFVMRASIPALALLALRVGTIAVSLPRMPRGLVLIILAVGAVTPLYEIGRTMVRPAFAISDCTLLQANRTPPNDGMLFHYLARLAKLDESRTAGVLARPEHFLTLDARGPCWPDHDRPEPASR